MITNSIRLHRIVAIAVAAIHALIGLVLHGAALFALFWFLSAAQAQAAACSAGSAGPGLYGSGTGLLAQLETLASDTGAGALDGVQAAPSCTPAEPASLAQTTPSSVAGNPVDLITGAKLERAVDVDLGGAAPHAPDDAAGFVVSRFYSSASAGSDALGPGWRLGLQVRLHALPARSGLQLQIIQGDGRHVMFGKAERVSAQLLRRQAVRQADGVLEQQAESSLPWVWRWRSGRQLFFDADGLLRRVDTVSGVRLSLSYDSEQRLQSVHSADARALWLDYQASGEGRLMQIRLSDGVLVRYRYDSAGRLAAVARADGAEQHYRYANQNGHQHGAQLISVRQSGQGSEYRYDELGRVVYSRALNASAREALEFVYRSGAKAGYGLTEVRGGGQMHGRYQWRADLGVIETAVGPGCPVCPPTGVRFRYASDGSLLGVTRLAATNSGAKPGQVTILRDHRGRPEQLRWRLAQGVEQVGAQGGAQGEARQLQLRWADDPVIDRVEQLQWPSQAVGRSVLARPVYGPGGQITGFAQTGFSPVITRLPGGRLQFGVAAVRREGAQPGFAPANTMRWRDEHRAIQQSARWHDDFGRQVALWSADAGLVQRRFNERDQLISELRADGALVHFDHDQQGRLIAQQLWSPPDAAQNDPDGPASRIDLHWQNKQLLGIDEPGFREQFERDAAGRITAHQIRLALHSGRLVQFEQRHQFDALGRLVAWTLPGGGLVHARRDAQGQVVALDWQPGVHDWIQPIVHSLVRGTHGLRQMVFGNGVRADFTYSDAGKPARIHHWLPRKLGRARASVLEHQLVFDEQGRLKRWQRDAQVQSYLHDRHGRLLQARSLAVQESSTWRYAYDFNGNRMFMQQSPGQKPSGHTPSGHMPSAHKPSGQRPRAALQPAAFAASPGRESSGLRPIAVRLATHGSSNRVQELAQDGQRALQWDQAGRLVRDRDRHYRWDGRGLLREVTQAGKELAQYRYNHRGQRIAKLVDGREILFLYDAQRRLLAELDQHGQVYRQYIYLADRPVAILDRVDGADGPSAFRLRYLHLNHLGAPQAASDETARVVWRGEYSPFGRLQAGLSNPPSPGRPGGFDLALRLPGQYEDAETGLHYNDHRYYDPESGRYLSPDPLGLAGGPNPYVYAGNDPLTKIDPSGLLLFAFDGTDNGDPPSRQDDWSNVYKLARAYADGRVWYMAGVGRDDAGSGIKTNGLDALNANTARMRIDYMLSQLEGYLAASAGASGASKTINVDVIGFSRGAAMARDFSNRVADRISDGRFAASGACVRLRFIGLWDTVAQFGANGLSNAGWRLAIPEQAAHVAHALALNEHRFLFPVESIVGSPLAGVRIERGFVGAHADVGGSYAEGDLSDVALGWMHQQALSAGVRMFALSSELARVSSPLLHDSSGGIGDREVFYRNNWGWIAARPMQKVAKIDGLQWRDTSQFIDWYPQPRPDVYGAPTLAGEVDMADYAQWLGANYGLGFIGVL